MPNEDLKHSEVFAARTFFPPPMPPPHGDESEPPEAFFFPLAWGWPTVAEEEMLEGFRALEEDKRAIEGS